MLGKGGGDLESWAGGSDLVREKSGWMNDTVASDEIACVISQNLGYTVFSTVGAFYLPLPRHNCRYFIFLLHLMCPTLLICVSFVYIRVHPLFGLLRSQCSVYLLTYFVTYTYLQ